MSDLMETLITECKRSSQRNVAAKIGYSATTINFVLRGTYKGDISAVESAVRMKLMCTSVPCPVLGEISAAECSDNQKRPFSASSSIRVRLFKNCKSCSFNTKRKDAS